MAGKNKAKNGHKRPRAKGKPRQGKRRSSHNRGKTGSRPTLVVKGHLMISVSMTGVNVKQINISPSLQNFAAPLVQSKFYQQYRCSRIIYTILPLDTVNTSSAVQQDLLYVYTVPITTPTIPIASQASYLAYKNVNVQLLDRKVRRRSFVPFVLINDAGSPNRMMARAPRIDVQDTTQVNYGHSLLFVKNSATAATQFVRIFVTAQFQFFTFDGNNAVAQQEQQFRKQFQNLVLQDQHRNHLLLQKAKTQQQIEKLQKFQIIQSVQNQQDFDNISDSLKGSKFQNFSLLLNPKTSKWQKKPFSHQALYQPCNYTQAQFQCLKNQLKAQPSKIIQKRRSLIDQLRALSLIQSQTN